MTELLNAQWSGVVNPEELGLNGFGSLSPIFAGALANAHFTRRLGGSSADFFYSGTFNYEELTIGYIRIPELRAHFYRCRLDAVRKGDRLL